jgi:Na+/melibiose symporter-like transporter
MQKVPTNNGANNGGPGAFQRGDYVKITNFGFALTALWQSLHTIILPLRLLDFVAESQKNTYLGLLTFTGLVLAMLVQPLAGAISDRAGFSWGRRRPFILLGASATLILLPGLGFMRSLFAIFIIYCLLQVSTNTAQGPYQAFIPDLAPLGKRGHASGVKSFLEIMGGVALIYPVALLMDRYFLIGESRWLWLALGLLAIIMLLATAATVILVRESPPAGGSRQSLRTTLKQTFKIDVGTSHSFIWFLISRLFVFMAFATIQQFALNFLRDVIGVANPAEATARFSIIAVVSMLVIVWPAGYLSDKIGRKPINIAAGLLGALGVAVIFSFQNYTSVLWGAGIIGIAVGAFNSTNWALATDLVPRTEEARYLGLTNLATAGGAALARLIGPLIDYLNRYDPLLGYQVMLLASIVYFVAGALLITRIKKQD